MRSATARAVTAPLAAFLLLSLYGFARYARPCVHALGLFGGAGRSVSLVLGDHAEAVLLLFPFLAIVVIAGIAFVVNWPHTRREWRLATLLFVLAALSCTAVGFLQGLPDCPDRQVSVRTAAAVWLAPAT